MRIDRKRLAGLVLVAAGAFACASAGERPGGAGVDRSAEVRVINDVQPPSSISVYLDAEVGGRTLLGTVDPLGRRTLTIRTVREGATYRLEARGQGGPSIVSGPFTVNPGETVTWDLSTNVVGP